MVDCRNRCDFCPQQTIISQYKKNGGTPLLPMSFSLFASCIDKLPAGCHVVFSGMCEPWLNPNCSRMVEYAYNKEYVVRVYTTLVGMKLSDVEILKRIDFPDDEHGFIIHLPSEENIEHIKIDKQYLHVLEEIYESSIPAQYHFHGLKLHPILEKFFRHRVATIEQFPPHSRAGNLQENELKKRRIGVIGCLKMKLYDSYGPILLPDGTMILCCQDYSMKHILGNLKDQTFEEILQSKEIKKIESGFKNERVDTLCRRCEYSYDVNWLAKIANKKINLPDQIQ